MEHNYIKKNPKKQKDYLYKQNYSNNHKKTKTETNILDDIPKTKNHINLKSLRIQNTKISLIPEFISQKNIKKINSVRPLTSSFYSNMDMISKSKIINNKNHYKNLQPFNIQSNNTPFFNIPEKKRNTVGYAEKELTIKKNKSNTSLSHIQQLKNEDNYLGDLIILENNILDDELEPNIKDKQI